MSNRKPIDKEGALDRAAAIVREHYPEGVIIVPETNDRGDAYTRIYDLCHPATGDAIVNEAAASGCRKAEMEPDQGEPRKRNA